MKKINAIVLLGLGLLTACSNQGQAAPVQEARFQEFCVDNSVEPPIHVDEDLCDVGDGVEYVEPRYAPNYVPYGIFVPPYGQTVVIRERTMQIPSSSASIKAKVEKYPKASSPIPPYRPPTPSAQGVIPPYVPPTLSPAQKADIDATAKAAKQATPPAVANQAASPGVGIRPPSQPVTPARVVTPARAASTPAGKR